MRKVRSNSNRKSAKSIQYEKRLLEVRNRLWPDAKNRVWSRHDYEGFTTIPRILPLMYHLLAKIQQSKNPYHVYVELWCRANDVGVIEVHDVDNLAYNSGYVGPRAARTWQERISILETSGFIETQSKANQKYAYILLINPYLVAAKMKSEGKVDENWWNEFADRCAFTKAKIPKV